MNRFFIILATALFLVVATIRIVSDIQYDRNIEGFLKQTADSNSIELAEERLEMAIAGIDRDGICPNFQDKTAQCHTSIFWRTPDENVAFWRRNLSDTLTGLKNMSPKDRQDESKSGIQLVKVRETLLDSGKSGDFVTSPQGISVYGNNGILAVLVALTLSLTVIGAVLTYQKDEW